MGQAVPRQHPAVVLRSHYTHLRALLAVAMIAVVGLTVAVVILATDDDATKVSSAQPVSAPTQPGVRYDGGPEEGTASLTRRSATSDSNAIESVPGLRYDGGPEEGSNGAGR